MVWCLHRIRRKKLDLSDEEKKNIDFNLNPKQRESALKAISKIKQSISDLNKFKQYIEERKKEWLEAENDGDCFSHLRRRHQFL
jgi:flagellar biosynthesis chaperone FliJ